MSRRAVVLAAVALGCVLGLVSQLSALKRSRLPGGVELRLPVSGGGVSVGWTTPPAHAAPAEHDFLIESDRLRLVVGSDSSSPERHERYGALVDFGRLSDVQDELIELGSALYVAGTPVPLRTWSVEVGKAGGRPLLAVESASSDGGFEVRTEYRLAPHQDYVELVSTVTNVSGKRQTAIQIGDRGRWPGTIAFAPRLGYVHLPTRADVPWFGRAGKHSSYGFVFPDRAAQVAFEFDVVGPSGEVALDPGTDLDPGASFHFRRDAIVVKGGLGKLAELAWKRLGKPIGRARGVLRPPPSWATVSARQADGRTVLTVAAAPDGSFELPLPTGDYRFVLQSPGGEDEQLGAVREGTDVELHFAPPRPGTLTYSMTDEHGLPLPSRLVVRGVPPTQDPDLVPGQNEAGSKNMLYSLTGSGSVELPPGRYEILATHGPEYSMPRQQLEVSADSGANFRGELARTVDTSGWIASDFHVHASPSKDSHVSLTDRVLTLAAEGIELAAATDHNHVTDYTESLHTEQLQNRLSAMTGVEVTTRHWGHFNAYPYAKSVDVPPTREIGPLEIFRVVRARAPQAVLQVNHPRMPGVGYFTRGELDTKTGVAQSPDFSFAFDTLEVSNGFDLEDPSVFERNLHEWFDLLNIGHRYTAVGNSDSHHVVFQWAGWPRTYVRVPDADVTHIVPLEVAKALKGGHASVSCGIFVLPTANGSAGPGDTVAGNHVALSISLRAPEWVDVSDVEVYANGTRVEHRTREAPAHRPSWDLEVDLQCKADTWIVVVARGNRFMNEALPGKWIKPFGFSNPIFVDADADGVFVTPGL